MLLLLTKKMVSKMHHYKPLNKKFSYPGHVITFNQKMVSKMHHYKPLNKNFLTLGMLLLLTKKWSPKCTITNL